MNYRMESLTSWSLSGETISIHGISAWVLGVLSQVSFLGTRYEEALLLAVEALVILHEVEQIPETKTLDMLKEAGFADVDDEEEFEEQVRRDFAVRREIRMGNPFSILSPQHLVAFALRDKANVMTGKWWCVTVID